MSLASEQTEHTYTLRVLLTYVDESFTARWYWIGALIVPEREAIPLSDSLDEVMTKASHVHGVDQNDELHGYDLFHARRQWRGVPPRARINVYASALKSIGRHDVKIIVRGVDRDGLRARYGDQKSAHEVVLSHLLERVDGFSTMCDEFALVIADEIDNQAGHRSDLRRYRVNGTGGYRSRRLTRIVDTLHFAPSHASRLVQAADLVTFLFHRMTSGIDTNPQAKAANEVLWKSVEPRVHHAWCWSPTVRQMHEGPACAGPKAGAGTPERASCRP